jgi:hypothetical protein
MRGGPAGSLFGMFEETFVAELVVGSRAEGRARQRELEAQADRWFGAPGSVWLGTEVTDVSEGGTTSGYRVRGRYGPSRAAATPPPGGRLQRAAHWLGLANRRP